MQRSTGASRLVHSSVPIHPGRLARPARQLRPPMLQAWGCTWILVVLLLTIFEGALRKWLVASIPPLRYAVYFSKDFVFVGAALAGMAQARSFGRILGILLTFSLISLSIPTLINLPHTTAVGALLSIRAYLIVPLCGFVAGGTLRSLRDVDRIAIAFGVSTLLVAALGLLQYSLPPSHLLNRYETGEETTRIIAEFKHVRATGTFAFITGMGMMTGVSGWAGIYLFLTSRGWLGRTFAAVVLFAGLCCGLVSMHRGGIVIYMATVVGAVVLFGGKREMFYLLLVFVIGYLFIGGGAASEEGGEDSVEQATLRRFTERDSTSDRASYFLMNLRFGLFNHPFGEGLGRGQNGGNYAETGVASWGGGYETELGRIGFEVGPLGWVGVVSWRIVMIALLWRELRRAKEKQVRALLAATLPLFALLSINFMAFNHTGSSFAWAIAALALGVATLSHRSVPAVSGRRTRGPIATLA